MKTILFIAFCILLSASAPVGLPPEKEICLSEEEKRLFDLIMEYRKSKGLKPLPYSAKLTKVAQAHVMDLTNNYDYDTRGDCNPHTWSNKGTWSSCCYTKDHAQKECMWNKPKEIAGYESEGYEIAYYSGGEATAVEGLAGWKESSGHNPLLINSETWSKIEWKGIGIGIHGHWAVVWFGELEDKSKLLVCSE